MLGVITGANTFRTVVRISHALNYSMIGNAITGQFPVKMVFGKYGNQNHATRQGIHTKNITPTDQLGLFNTWSFLMLLLGKSTHHRSVEHDTVDGIYRLFGAETQALAHAYVSHPMLRWIRKRCTLFGVLQKRIVEIPPRCSPSPLDTMT